MLLGRTAILHDLNLCAGDDGFEAGFDFVGRFHFVKNSSSRAKSRDPAALP
jgi:hypothetical protein